MATDILKPKDWPAFQRNCVVLFRAELKDPNTKEYGRNGQNQGGIDILGYRKADPTHGVGIQCRRIDKSLTRGIIMRDCRAALALEFGLKEVIFATTAPDDTKSDQAAKAVERELRSEGLDVTVTVYGWGQLQTLISMHEPAFNAFVPTAVATTRPVSIEVDDQAVAAIAARLADELVRQGKLTLTPQPASVLAGPDGIGDEDPALHAKIDVYRELVRGGDGRLAEQKLIALRDGPAADAPWARYRIETNIAAAAMEGGREAEAAAAYVRAAAIRPDDPNALANLSLARTIQGDPDEGMAIARRVLERPDRTDFALSALLQAAARSSWDGDPESLVPEVMRGTPSAELAIADFLRKRWLPGWEARVLALPNGETEFDNVARLKALAVLSIAVDNRLHVVGGSDIVTDAEIDDAATEMSAHALHCLRSGYADVHDLMAHVSNAGLLLRLAGRLQEAETLLREGLRSLPDEDQLMRLLAMVLVDLGRSDEAVRVIEPGKEPETILMKVQFAPKGTPAERLRTLQEMPAPSDERVAGMRRRLMAELALAAGDETAAADAIRDMMKHPDDVIAARLLDLKLQQAEGLEADQTAERLTEIARNFDDSTNPIDRFLVAEIMVEEGLAEAASDLIASHVDLGSPRPATFLYLTALAEARRDDAFRTALAASADDVRESPAMLWLDARHSWNAGDIERSLADIERLLEIKPNLPKAVLMRIEALLRLGRSEAILEVLDGPIEELPWAGSNDQFRIAGLLSHFGHHDRAARYAYRLFLQHRDRPRAWMTLSGMTIREGRDPADRPDGWSPETIGTDVAVDLEYDDGEKTFFIVESDPSLRALDPESWEPEHSLIRAIAGMAVGATFTGPDGRTGRVANLRHKIVARFHFVIANYENRFPDVFGFKSMNIDPESPTGLDAVIKELKDQRDWVLAEQESHLASGMPIDVLARRLGVDTIDVSQGLAEQGIKRPVAAGTEPERAGVDAAIITNAKRGCVMDLLAFWTAWRLGVLGEVAEVCGPITIPRSVVDRLRARSERLGASAITGHRSFSYMEGGRILDSEVSAERVTELRDDTDAAIAWIEANCASKPMVMDDSLPAALREHIREGVSDMLDPTALAITSGCLLVSDDPALRTIHARMGGSGSAWLHAVLTEAYLSDALTARDFTQHTVDMIDAGQSNLGVTGIMIAMAMEMDAQEAGVVGRRGKALTSRLGGARAEPKSHLYAACSAMAQLWTTDSVLTVREAGTGRILENLISERDDWRPMLEAVEVFATGFLGMNRYVREWARGHFLPGYC
ncbi:tetratricopeptide repeat protein [Sphingomonas citri]